MTPDVALDLFGCEGGFASGLARVWREVWSVDIDPLRAKRNPHSWHVGDWREGLDRALATGRVAYVHASPPCQLYTRAGHLGRAQGRTVGKVDLVAPVRAALVETGLPWTIENVEGAPVEAGSLMLCGSEFGLHVKRHRLFESNVWLMGAGGCVHGSWPDGRPWGVYGRAGDQIPAGGRTARNVAHARELLGVTHAMTWRGLTECLPPAYGEFIGAQVLALTSADSAPDRAMVTR